jgi:hypothetical protein
VASSRQVLVNRAMADPLGLIWWRLALDGHPAAFSAGGRLESAISASDLEAWRRKALTRATVEVRAAESAIPAWRAAVGRLPVALPPDHVVMPPARRVKPVFTLVPEYSATVRVQVGVASEHAAWTNADIACWKAYGVSKLPETAMVTAGCEPGLAAWLRIESLKPSDWASALSTLRESGIADSPCAGLNPLDPRQSVWVVQSAPAGEGQAPPDVSPDTWKVLPADPVEWIR